RIATGSIALAVSGVSNASIVVTGPGGYTRAVSATETLVNLQPGTYTVTAAELVVNNATYTPTPAMQQVVVTASVVAAPAVVTYHTEANTGTISVSVAGLPGGAAAQATLVGPQENINKVTVNVTSSMSIPDLLVGTYTLTASDVVF